MKAYLHDPELLQRYNYGRGQPGRPVSNADRTRVSKAQSWLISLKQQGFPPDAIRKLIKAIPYIGPYATLTNYTELLLALPC